MNRPKRPQRSERDLSSLLGASAQLTKSSPLAQSLPVSALRAGTFQPRRTFDERSLATLADSIRAEGVLQPLLVRPVGSGYEIVAGERRWRAAKLAGLTEVPVYIRELDDRQALAAGLLENLQRENLNVIDEVDGKLHLAALALNMDTEAARSRLIRLTKETPGEEHALLDSVFEPLGETWVSFAKNKLRILNWPAEVVDALRNGLSFTIGAVVAGAPKALRGHLLEMALKGATRSELRAELERHNFAGKKPSNFESAPLVSRRLANQRFLAALTDDQQKALERWLSDVPDFLKDKSRDP